MNQASLSVISTPVTFIGERDVRVMIFCPISSRKVLIVVSSFSFIGHLLFLVAFLSFGATVSLLAQFTPSDLVSVTLSNLASAATVLADNINVNDLFLDLDGFRLVDFDI